MRTMRFSLTAATVLGLLLVAVALQSTVGAQTYPPPIGSLSSEATPSPATVGTTATVTATVRDSAGDPVADAEVVFQITSQPGSGAAFADGLAEITALTDANGVATAILSVGDTTGSIIVEIVSGEKVSQATVQVQSAAGLPPTGGPPSNEGDGGLSGWQTALIVAGVAILIGGGLAVGRRRRS